MYRSNGYIGVIRLVRFYNPCSELSVVPWEKHQTKWLWVVIILIIWLLNDYFNAHTSIWGSRNTDKNGEVIEEFMEENSLVCLNDGNSTRIYIIRGAMSCLDITIVSASLTGKCIWSVSKDNSDHFPVICEIQNKIQIQNWNFVLRWIYKKAEKAIWKSVSRGLCWW